MASYVDLNSVHVPTLGEVVPAEWGTAVRDNFEAIAGSVATARIRYTSSKTISTTETEVGGVTATTLTIPSDWNTYTLDTVGQWRTKGFGGTGSETLTLRVKVNGSNAAVTSDARNIASASDVQKVPINDFQSAWTATGSLAVTCTTQMGDQSGKAAHDAILVLITATRTS